MKTKILDSKMKDISFYRNTVRRPDFNNFLKILRHEKPERPVLFELFLNDKFYERLTNKSLEGIDNAIHRYTIIIEAFANAGYDYATVFGSDFIFVKERQAHGDIKTISINEGGTIIDETSFNKYMWPNPDKCDYSHLKNLRDNLPGGMKLMVMGPGGVLRNVINLVGYEQLCYMVMDNPCLAEAVFEQVGKRLVRFFEICASYDTVGMLTCNDDWGFKGQTMLSVKDMRKYVFPWHKKIVEVIHAAGKPALLHSCGNLTEVMNDIVYDMKYDAKHSYEDNIQPVEEVYEEWNEKIAILGGIDMDFISRGTPQEIYNRSCAMLARTSCRGGYALGSGNSIPYYVPEDNYLSMIAAAH